MFWISIACAFLNVHCGVTKDDFPRILLGKWTTESERYQDRYIEFSREMIVFGTGFDSPNIYIIRKVDQKRNGPENEYTFSCIDTDNTEFVFIFHVKSGGGDLSLRLNNPREVIWHKFIETDESI